MAFTISGYFAGIAGIEEGFHQFGAKTVEFCEKDPRAQKVLRSHFSDIPILGDIAEVKEIPPVDMMTAGFPCQDLSQAGLKKGIDGQQSGLVQHIFRLLDNTVPDKRPEWILIENVSYMISLDQGNAIQYLTGMLEKYGYSWGYRVLDARAFGVPQRRLRLILLAAKHADVRQVLFSQNIDNPPVKDAVEIPSNEKYYGFYWTEGKRGLGWTIDGIPTLKIGSKIGIPSPPAIWIPSKDFFGTPDISDAERLQGFKPGWTAPVESMDKPRRGDRWHLVGNAVCVNMSSWVAERVFNPLPYETRNEKKIHRKKWPKAAFGYKGNVYEIPVSTWPVQYPGDGLSTFLRYPLKPLSYKGLHGFYTRAVSSELINYPPEFITSMEKYLEDIKEG